jgi:integrase
MEILGPEPYRTLVDRGRNFFTRALARGDDPEVVIQPIADYRSEDKDDSNYYARHTVTKAQADLHRGKTVWTKTLRRAKIPYFRTYDLRSAYATRLSAGGVAYEWVTQLLRRSDAQVFKKYPQMKSRMKREALHSVHE